MTQPNHRTEALTNLNTASDWLYGARQGGITNPPIGIGYALIALTHAVLATRETLNAGLAIGIIPTPPDFE